MRPPPRCAGRALATQPTGGARGWPATLARPPVSRTSRTATDARRDGGSVSPPGAPACGTQLAAYWHSAQSSACAGTQCCSECSSTCVAESPERAPLCHASAIDATPGIAICSMAKNRAARRNRRERLNTVSEILNAGSASCFQRMQETAADDDNAASRGLFTPATRRICIVELAEARHRLAMRTSRESIGDSGAHHHPTSYICLSSTRACCFGSLSTTHGPSVSCIVARDRSS
jgi:hypothetical protein